MIEGVLKRIAVFSDTHGNRKDMREAVSRFNPLDLIIHLGDGVHDGIQIAREASIPFQGVYGNEDFGADLPGKIMLEIEGWRFLLTHGHHMDINPYHPKDIWRKNMRDMALWAEQQGAQSLFFGHAHVPVLQREGGIVLCNPGDQFIGSGSGSSFALVETGAEAVRFRILRKRQQGQWEPLSELWLRRHAI